MAIEVFLGNPPENIKAWIEQHAQPASTEHEETWYKYSGDTEWRTKMLSGEIALVDYMGTPTGQIDNPGNIIAIEIGTGTQENPLTSIAESGFSQCRSLTSIIVPSTMTSIGYTAFYCCSGISSVTLNCFGTTDAKNMINGNNFIFGDCFTDSNWNVISKTFLVTCTDGSFNVTFTADNPAYISF